jgi:hypothetical protein
MADVVVALLTVVAVLGGARWWRQRRGRTAIVVAAEPDAALLSSAAALRRLGARITRYDVEGGTLEARLTSRATVHIRTAAGSDGTTRVHVNGDAGARRVVRRFRSALSA